MRLRRVPWIVAATCWFFGLEARAADLAVMPVGASGLSPGDAEALGVLLARAVARDAHVVVASPQETKPLLDGGQTAAVAAGRLGVSSYIELTATRVERAVTLSGALFGADGTLLFQAETSGPSLEEMDFALSALAHALVWRKPVAVAAVAPSAPERAASEPAAATTQTPSAYRGSYGPKVGLVMPRASGRSFSPSYAVQFDARFGPPSYFVELGAGLLIPINDSSSGSTVAVSMAYVELGASHYLWAGDGALYLGAGFSPAVWDARALDDSHTAATCSVYAQLGLGINRGGRVRLYWEVRLSQVLLAVAHPVSDGTAYGTTRSDPYRPLLVAFQGGLGW
jgi:hypothetical protein